MEHFLKDVAEKVFLKVFNTGYIGPHSIVHETEFALAALESQVVVKDIFFYSTISIVAIIQVAELREQISSDIDLFDDGVYENTLYYDNVPIFA